MSHGHHHHGDESHHDHSHEHSHDHPHTHTHSTSEERKWHRDWRVWVAAILMVGLLLYCLATFIL